MNLSLSGLLADLFAVTEKFISKKYWRIKFVFALTFISLILSTGAYFYLPTAMVNENWLSFNEKKNHPLTPLTSFDENSHAAKKTFRLTVPVIAKVFHLGNYAVFLLQFAASILLLFFSILLVEKITGDSITALLTTFGLVFIYAGHAGFTDINTWFDEFAFLFLLLALLSERWYLIFIFLQLACWTDERAIISCGLIFIWWKLKEEESFSLRSLFNFRLNSSVVILAVFFYAAERIVLTTFFHLTTPLTNVGLKTILNDTDFMGMAIWTALEGYWILILITLLILWRQKKYFLKFSIICFITILTLGAFSVFDKTRSISYLFPLIFISVFLLNKFLSRDDLRKLILVSAVVCFLFPSYYIISDVKPYILWYKPIFIRVLDLINIKLYGN